MRIARKIALAVALTLLLTGLSGCDALRPEARTASAPDLSRLSFAPYEDEEAARSAAAADYYRVDLWLDGTQDAGGINPEAEGLYPHYSKKYREGGFHYKLKGQTGWYESVLRHLLGAADGTRVRMLRYGNEQVPAGTVAAIAGSDDASALASVGRDLRTYALDPDASVFSTFSDEEMTGSFYSLGTPKLNQMARFLADGGAELENPGKAGEMSAALNAVIASVAAGRSECTITKGRDERECALLSALECLDTSRLSVLTLDPASLGRVAGADEAGRPVGYYEQALRALGVFDKGLCVGLYAFTLDYIGQLKTVCAAELSEPLIWGKPIYDSSSRQITGAGAMPRVLLALVIGPEKQVADYMGKLDARLQGDASLKGLRGPEDGELTYSTGGMTVTQQPFSFACRSLVVSRPSSGYYTQHAAGFALTGAETEKRDGLDTVLFAPEASGGYADRVLTLRFPLTETDAMIDPARLTNARGEPVSTLLRTETLENTVANAAVARDGQTLAYRDKLYVYSVDDAPEAGSSPFALRSVRLEDGALVFEVATDGAKLREGYYRLRLCCDLSGEAIDWPEYAWVDGISASVDADDCYAWETFSAAVGRFEGAGGSVSRAMQHAWGPYSAKGYHGLTVPDCPPVWRALNLAELVDQLRAAAAPETKALVRCVFDVFADNQ